MARIENIKRRVREGGKDRSIQSDGQGIFKSSIDDLFNSIIFKIFCVGKDDNFSD
jgi:hypothetical protein